LPLWVLHSEMGIEQNKWSSNGCSILDGRFELDTARAPYLGALIVVLQNGFNVWLTRWRHMDHLQCPFLTNFGYMAHPLEIALAIELKALLYVQSSCHN
jgi:hypothetical protein